MSDLRDNAAALRAMNSRMTTIEECLLTVLHKMETEEGWREEAKKAAEQASQFEKALGQTQNFFKEILHQFTGLKDQLDNLSATRLDDVKDIKRRMWHLEKYLPANEEPTQP